MPRIGSGRALCIALCVAAGCKERSSAPAAPPAARDAAAQAVDEASARALLDRWMAAQNGADFDAYAALYAADFTGVRRSGAKKVDLDRAAWLRERKRMFARPVAVSVDQIRIAAEAGAAQVDFVQTWVSGSYSDRGPKRMRLSLEGDQLRIAREEMLESRILPADAGAADADAADADAAFDDAAAIAGSFTGKGTSEKAILRIHEGETTAPHGEESGQQGFLQTERRAELIIERGGREVVTGDLGSWTDGWEWGTKIKLAGSFPLGATGIQAVVLEQVASTEGGQSVTIRVVRAAGDDIETLWEGSAEDGSVAIGPDTIDVSLVDATGDEPYFGESSPGRDDIVHRDLELKWKRGTLVATESKP